LGIETSEVTNEANSVTCHGQRIAHVCFKWLGCLNSFWGNKIRSGDTTLKKFVGHIKAHDPKAIISLVLFAKRVIAKVAPKKNRLERWTDCT